jgi:AcrR family transcriptional regulator
MGIKERQERDRESVRRGMLDAARELFVREGYQNVSIRKIAERIEYSPAAIYGYFPSKDDIFFALAEEGFRLLTQFSSEDEAGVRALPPLDRVRAGFWHLYEFSREHPQYFSLLFLDRSVPRIRREHARFAFLQAGKKQLFEDVQCCVDEGIFPPSVNASGASHLLYSAILGVAVLRLSERLDDHDDADVIASDALDVTLAGLRSGLAIGSHAVCPDLAVPADATTIVS